MARGHKISSVEINLLSDYSTQKDLMHVDYSHQEDVTLLLYECQNFLTLFHWFLVGYHRIQETLHTDHVI